MAYYEEEPRYIQDDNGVWCEVVSILVPLAGAYGHDDDFGYDDYADDDHYVPSIGPYPGDDYRASDTIASYYPDSSKHAHGSSLYLVVLLLIALLTFVMLALVFNPDLTLVSFAPPVEDEETAGQNNDSGVIEGGEWLNSGYQSDGIGRIYAGDGGVLTQGPHGMAYGHYALDISAGNGATIYSPITGWVSVHYIDPLDNTVLVLENDQYIVTLLHGLYTLAPGDPVGMGQPVGSESNMGNTYDWAGNSCRNRDCGYHTHISVFDKSVNRNHQDPIGLIYQDGE